MNGIHQIAVFCGSSMGNHPLFREGSLQLARILNQHHINLVYGGGNVGLMGIIADEMLKLGSEVIGVIPQKLVDIEVAHNGLTHLHIVRDMFERKARMMELSDAFVILPGGTGTLDEFFEVLTLKQLGYHSKAIAVLNINGFFDPLTLLIENLVEQGFLHQRHLKSILISDSPRDLLKQLLQYAG